MAKLKLDVDALAVESFRTEAAPGVRGTVLGAAGREPTLRTVDEACGTGAEDTGCTAPCMSGPSFCEMESCGSSCYAASCYALCEAEPAPHTA